MKNTKWLLWGLIFLSLFLFTYKLGSASLWETDEYIYTQISKEIISSGDWLTLHLKGQPWFIHPPLHMWLTAVFGFLFGFSEFTARLTCALFGVLGVIAVYYFGKILYNERAGLLAGLILATSFQYIIQSRLAIFDIPLTALILTALLFFWLAYNDGRKKFYYLFYFFMALGILMKGPVAVILPGLLLFVYLLIQKDLIRVVKEAKIIPGAMIILFLGLGWYFAEYLVHGKIFADRVLGFYTWGRYFDVVETHAGPWYYYFGIVSLGFLPWSVFLPAGLYRLFKERNKKENLFLLLSIILIFIFFSAAKTKLPGYIMSIYPFLALGIGAYLSGKEAASIKKITLFFMFFFSSFLFVILGLVYSPQVVKGCEILKAGAMPIIFILAFSLFLAMAAWWKEKKNLAIGILAMGMLVFLLVFANITTPAIEEYKPMKYLSSKINQAAGKNDEVAGYKIIYKLGFEYYLKPKVKWIDTAEEFKKEVYSKRIIILPKEEDEKIKLSKSSRVLGERAGILVIKIR